MLIMRNQSKVVNRDTKGLYREGLNGEIDNLIDIVVPYELGMKADLILNTEKEISSTFLNKLLNYILENE